MAYEMKPNTGTIFTNDEKNPDNPAHETWPDSKGSALIDGVEYWVNCWRKFPKDKKPYLSMSFTPKERQSAKPQQEKEIRFPSDDSVPY
jgi:hypothetical protein